MKNPLFSALRRAAACIALLALAGHAMAISCPAGKVEQGGLCYSPPRAGYTCTGAACMEDCRSGYSPSVPGFCHYNGSLTYTEKAFGKHHDSTPHKCLALYYANCRAGYHMDVCGICTYKGAWDTTRHTYFREPGFSPDFAKAFNQVASVSQATYSSSLGAMKQGYEASVAEVQKGLDAATLALFKAAAKTFNKSDAGAKLKTAATLFAALDATTVANMQRILVLVASNANLSDADKQDVANTMIDVGRKTGLFKGTATSAASTAQVAKLGNAQVQALAQPQGGTGGDNGSYGIYAGAAGAYYAGVNSSFGIVVNADTDSDGKLQIMVISTIGGSIGAAVHVEGMVGLTESPRGVDQTPGPQIGLASGFETPKAGIDGALDWSLYKGMRGAQNAVPSTSIALTVGEGYDIVSLTSGYTAKMVQFSVPVK
jgi:hypothetical protein